MVGESGENLDPPPHLSSWPRTLCADDYDFTSQYMDGPIMMRRVLRLYHRSNDAEDVSSDFISPAAAAAAAADSCRVVGRDDLGGR